MPVLLFNAFFTLILRFLLTSATAATFDCKIAQTKVEKIICGDNGMTTLYDQLNSLYTRVRKSNRDAQAEKALQRAWLKARDTCADLACLRRLYAERIAELQAASSIKNRAQPVSAIVITSESYTLNESFSRGEQPSCRFLVCVKLDTNSDGSQNIWALVDMSDSHGVLEIDGPVTKTKNGVMSFRFKDDWGNVGKGTFKTAEKKGYLSLKITSSAPDSDPNIRRNYGESTVAKGVCKTDRS